MDRIALLASCLAWSACGDSIPAQTAPSPAAAPAVLAPAAAAAATELDARFVAGIRAAGSGYQAWGRVDERPNIAPLLCRAPLPQDYGSTGDIHLTQAEDDSPHGKKLYYLYSSDRDGYVGLATSDDGLPIGFTVVKQSFTAKEVDKATVEPPFDGRRVHWIDPITGGDMAAPGARWVETATGTVLIPDQPKDLFVMTKVAMTAIDGTDDGWVYGTIAPDGQVTSAGRVARCMGCHVEMATHERLFGMK